MLLIFSFGLFARAAIEDPETPVEIYLYGSANQELKATVHMTESCALELGGFRQLLSDYWSDSYWGRKDSNKKSKAEFRAIQAALERVRTRQPKCYPTLSGFYAWVSFAKLNEITDRDYQFSLVRLAATLFEQKIFSPLTPELRAELGGPWVETAHKLTGYRVMGAYDCESAKIWFDPGLRPYDLGAVILHEIEHLTRDKVLYWEPKFVDNQDPYFLLLMDETLSALHAAFAEMSLRKDLNRASARSARFPIQVRLVDIGLSIKRQDYPRFTLSGDFNLYSKKGEIERLWKKVVRTEGFRRFAPFSEFFPLMLRRENYASFIRVLDMVSRVYFIDVPPKTQEALDRIHYWSSDNSCRLVPLATFQDQNNGLSGALSFIDLVLGRLKTKSYGCSVLSEAIRKGHASGYFGNEGSRPGNEGSRPGNEGSRPGISVFPCIFTPKAL